MSVYMSQIEGGFLTISRRLASHFNCIYPVVILDELIFIKSKSNRDGNAYAKYRPTSYQKIKEGGWFCVPIEELDQSCFIGKHIRKKCLQTLVKSGVLLIEKLGCPARYHYKINEHVIDELICNKNERQDDQNTGDSSQSCSTSDTNIDRTGDTETGRTSDTKTGRTGDTKIGPSPISNNLNNNIYNNSDSDLGNLEPFDFEALYKKYPSKRGKSRGLKLCRSKIKTKNEFDDLSIAIDNYAEDCRNRNVKQEFIKHFSTFMSEWEDWVKPEQSEDQNWYANKTEEELKREFGL